MKRIFAILLALAMVAACLAGCSSKKEETPAGSTPVGTGGSVDVGKVTFEELTVVDNDQCSIKIIGVDPDNFWGYSVKVELENKSQDTTYMFSVTDAAVCGIQTTPLFATEVTAGKKAVDDIIFLDTDLTDNGITAYTDIELFFRVYDNDDWSADDIAKVSTHIYPYGEDKASTYQRAPQDTDQVIVDNEYATVTITGYENDPIWGFSAKLFVENKSDKSVMFSVDDASVNGYMVDPYWASAVLPDKCAFGTISWSDTSLEDAGITEIESVEFILKAIDYDDWFSDDLVNQPVTLTGPFTTD